MSQAEAHSGVTNTADHGTFLRARLASALAVFPLGVWTFFHLWDNLAAFYGGAAWEAAVTHHASPVGQLITGVVVLVPLALHTVWGISRLASTKPNTLRYRAYANFKYVLQRLAAIGVLLFLGAHLWLAMIHPRLTTGQGEAFADIAHEMRFHTPTLVVYLLGTLGVTFHLANGLQTVAMGWGLVTSRTALRRLEWGVIALFLLMLGMAWAAIFALYGAGVGAGVPLPPT
jgi:succinate dehydrogenase / fumarate reductase cytochrome b subunit